MTASANQLSATDSSLLGELVLAQPADLAALGITEPRTLRIYARSIPCPMEKYPDAWKDIYEIVETLHHAAATTPPRTYRLQQHDSVMYHDGTGTDKREMADMLKPAQMPCLRHRPRWKRADASWPLAPDGTLFTFAAHFYAAHSATEPHNQRPSTGHPTTNALYLFLHPATADQLQFRIFNQGITEQTAEEHYALEDSISAYDKARNNPAKLESIIRAGNKYFHEYLLDQPKLAPAALAALSAHGKTKQLRAAAQKLLNS